MPRTWTDAQKAAIDIQNKTLLVSAAAGSGKTATLTERIIRTITDKERRGDISKMLVVTFTKAAAAELKSRIFSSLSEELAKDPKNKHLTYQLIKLGSAKISTIDAFYLDLIRSNFSHLGISPSFKIADSAELDILANELMNDSIEHFYETEPEFPRFCECFTNAKHSNDLAGIFLGIRDDVISLPDGIAYLKKNAEETRASSDRDFYLSSYGNVLRGRVKDELVYQLTVLRDAYDTVSTDGIMSQKYGASFEYIISFFEELIATSSTDGYSATKDLLGNYSPIPLQSMPKGTASDESKYCREKYNSADGKITDIKKKFFARTEAEIKDALIHTASYTELIYALLLDFESRFAEEKRRRNVMDFNDIKRYTLKLLVDPDGTPTPVARDISTQYSEIYIDEYQDVDMVQDLIFSSIANGNRFLVGDIKQSIYVFRGAEPQLFANYRGRFPDHDSECGKDADSVTVFMSENFRCDRSVIDFTNKVCSRIFSYCADSLDYRRKDDLIFSKGNAGIPCSDSKVKIHIITPYSEDGEISVEEEEPEESLALKDSEVTYIASEIKRLIRTERKADGKPLRPGDFAVLYRSGKMCPLLAEALSQVGLKSTSDISDKYFEDPDVLMMLCILNSVDNPQRDIYLAGTLRSPIFGFSMDDLITVKNHSRSKGSLYDAVEEYAEGDFDLSRKCGDFIKTLEKWRIASLSVPVDKFIKMLFAEERFAASGLIRDITNSDGGNLLRLYEYARNFESGSFKGLYDFIEYINSVIEKGQKIEVTTEATSPDKVNLVTIHHSKGLEFPVCFICNASGRFNDEDSKDSLLLDHSIGVALKLPMGRFARLDTPMREAILIAKKIKQIEEEMRVLYVALTRARERLYITASTRTRPQKLLEAARKRIKFDCRYSVLSEKSYLDWILDYVVTDEDSDIFELEFAPQTSVSKVISENEFESEANAAPERDAEFAEFLREKYSFEYPYADLRRIPAKLSVSRLSPDVLDEEGYDTSAELFEPKKRATIPDFFIKGKESQASAAERGTATHIFFQFCDFSRLTVNGADKEIDRLVAKGFIPEATSRLIYKDEVERFASGELIKRIRAAKKVIREQRFNIMLPASAFTTAPETFPNIQNENLAVQGVIDLILINEDGGISLYDYKTDRLTREELTSDALAAKKMNELHALQLSYYVEAIRLLFGKEPDEVSIWSTHASKLYPIDKKELVLITDNL